MRDPQATLVLSQDWVIRHLHADLSTDHPLHSDSARKWVCEGLLIPYEWLDARRLRSPKIPFVSSPEEWSDAQLYEAGCLTLALLERANAVGADLKDASAWNVIFDGSSPVFCDLTSLEPIATHAWWAAGQFVRHFISPLWLAQTTGMQARDVFKMNRDGAMPELVRKTLGWRRFFSRYWPLVAQGQADKRFTGCAERYNNRTIDYRRRLVASLRWMLKGVKPQGVRNTVWAQYTERREHYEQVALDAKRQKVQEWLGQLRPEWTLDLGCNNGEFSRMALDSGSKVIALDADHDAIQALYFSHAGQDRIYPVFARLDDIHGGRGWAGQEHSGLMQRLGRCADLVMLLAIVHHLTIAAAVYLDQVARFAAACTRRWLIVEFLAPTDPQVKLLSMQRRRNAEEFSLDRQREAFITAGFQIRQEIWLPNSHRVIALLEIAS